MKATVAGVEVDCTPAELNEFLSLQNGREPKDKKHSPRAGAELWSPFNDEDSDRSSPYYSIPRKRYKVIIAKTYDYVARYKNGRTTEQVSAFFNGALESTVRSRLQGLVKDGLLEAPVHRGGHWTAVSL
jgi:hypothetical protein